LCDGSHKVTSLQPHRFVVEESGTFNLCGCKGTDDRPFCDGTHNML
jgi:CDGSH-type Zn-finger protein